MNNSREKMEHARDLIKIGKYDDARTILRTVDHPLAVEWLRKIDLLSPLENVVEVRQFEPNVKLQYIQTINIVCPRCEMQINYSLNVSDPIAYQICPSCTQGFLPTLAIIRAKRSRGNKKYNRREFTIRIIDMFDRQRVIEFVRRSDYADFELRSKDLAVFTYIGDRLYVLQNLTTNQYMLIDTLRGLAKADNDSINLDYSSESRKPSNLKKDTKGNSAAAIAYLLVMIFLCIVLIVVFSGTFGSTCSDGWHSSSTGSGTCSHHKGIR